MSVKVDNIEHIADQFKIAGTVSTIVPFGGGHINDTFRIINSDTTAPDYLLQRINHSVFPDVPALMKNIDLVTAHLKQKPDYETLDLIHTHQDKLFYQDQKGNYWRIFDFKTDTTTFDLVTSEVQAFQGGLAFGKFLMQLDDFDPRQLSTTIPDFHNVMVRLQQLNKAQSLGNQERRMEVQALLKQVMNMADTMCQLERMKQSGTLKMRVTHNDTKFNNVLLHENQRFVCVIDLDTVMPGIVHYDFGDGIRTATNSAAEDEKDLHNVHFNIGRYNAFAKGYLEGAQGILEPTEIEYLPLSGAAISYVIGVRFLTDYLLDDVYFKTSYPDQNLRRAMSQIELSRQILARQKDLELVFQQASVKC
ncbi:MAG: aminoglycoside phosphotransferase family protein [Cyclobacteriaceae bacterium]